jgi:hypothetical protein
MGSITAASVISKAAILLMDVPNTRWTRAEMLGWINDGQRQVTQLRPTANNVLVSVKLVAGSRQVIPPDGWLLLDIIRNMGADGLTPGKAIRLISRELLDAYNPDWHTISPAQVSQNYIFNIQNQITFYVYPPSDGTGFLEVNYSQIPPDLPNESALISVGDVFEPMLVDYVMYRCCSKDAEYAPGLRLAAMYWKNFTTLLDKKEQAELENSPNLDLSPRDPTIPGGSS